METFSIGYALLATQGALLYVVTPELRAVVIDVCKKKKILYMHFYYEGEISEELIELWQCAITEASDLEPDCELDDKIERLDYPQEIPSHCGRYAYLRKEPSLPRQNSLEVPIIITREMRDFKERIDVFISPISEEKVDTSWGVIHKAEDKSYIIPAKPTSYQIEIFPLAYALLSIQRALLGLAIPELRSIVADIQEQELYIRFYYDKGIPHEVLKSWEFAITKVIADMGSDYLFDTRIERLDYPQEIPFRGRYAYLRKE